MDSHSPVATEMVSAGECAINESYGLHLFRAFLSAWSMYANKYA